MAAYYNDNDQFAAAWLRELIKAGVIADGEVDTRSIELVQPDDLRGFTQCHFFAGIGGWAYALRLAGWPDDRPVWTGSCPCQPWSVAGSGEGVNDPRHLWPTWFPLIRECRPPTVFGEQTSGVDGRYWLDLVLSQMEDIDYALGAFDLPAACVGAPHGRARLWIVAHDNRQGCGELTPTRLRERWPRAGGQEAAARSVDGPWGGDAARCGVDDNAGGVAVAEGRGRNVGLLHRSCESAGADRGRTSTEPQGSSRPGDVANGSSGGLGMHGRSSRPTGHADEREPTHDVADAVRDPAGEYAGELSSDEGAHDEWTAHGDHRTRHGRAADGMAVAESAGGWPDARAVRGSADEGLRESHDEWGAIGETGGAGDRFATRDVADAEYAQRWPLGGSVDDVGDGRDGGRTEAHGVARARRAVCDQRVLADADGGDTWDGDLQRSGEYGLRTESRCAVGDAGDDQRAEGGDVDLATSGGWERLGSATTHGESLPTSAGDHGPGIVGGFWADAEWLPCTDGKARPVESKYIKMADGLSGTLVPLRRASECDEAQEPENLNASTTEAAIAEFVRLLPSSLAFAELHGDRATAEALHALLETSGAERLLQYPPHQMEAAWRSLSQEVQDSFRVGVEEGGFMKTVEHPLAHGVPARVGRLRGYGNAVVPELAATVILAYLIEVGDQSNGSG